MSTTVAGPRCQLFTVIRTSLTRYDRTVLSYPPSDYQTAVRRAEWYQQQFDPACKYYDWRVHMCS